MTDLAEELRGYDMVKDMDPSLVSEAMEKVRDVEAAYQMGDLSGDQAMVEIYGIVLHMEVKHEEATQ